MTVLARTAEWNCTRCGVTNRQLVPATATEVKDRCLACRTDHVLRPGARPVRWEARMAG